MIEIIGNSHTKGVVMVKQLWYVLLFSVVFNSVFASDDEGCKGCGCFFRSKRKQRAPQTEQPTFNDMDPYAADRRVPNAQASLPSIGGPSLYETAENVSLDMATEIPNFQGGILQIWFQGALQKNPRARTTVQNIAQQLGIPFEISPLLSKADYPVMRIKFSEGNQEIIEQHFKTHLAAAGNINGLQFLKLDWMPRDTRLTGEIKPGRTNMSQGQ